VPDCARARARFRLFAQAKASEKRRESVCLLARDRAREKERGYEDV